jgi:hypothetical protein
MNKHYESVITNPTCEKAGVDSNWPLKRRNLGEAQDVRRFESRARRQAGLCTSW